MEGKTVFHYRILEKLGEGGMGEVYLAEDTSLERKVALKFLPDYLQQDPVAQKRFLREAKSAAALDHPYICKIFETGAAEGKNFIAMEYVKGQTLKEKLSAGNVPLKQTLQIGMEIAEALEKAHKAGIAHRDLKPANIMLTSGGHIKVMDFGLAKKVVDEDGTEQDITSALTREGTTLGTLAYMSPEQLRGKTVDTRSDIFSFGIVLYELLSGVHPFRKPKQVDTTGAIPREDPAPLSRYTEDTADLLQHTVEKMLEKDADDRYQTVHEVRSNLKKLSEKLSAPDVIPVLVKAQRNIWLGAGAVLLVLIAVLLGMYLYQPSTSQVEEAPIESIAVLPFEDLMASAESEYLSYGIGEGLALRLAKIRGLTVLSVDTLKRYKGREVDPTTAAKELRVSAVLRGTLRGVADSVTLGVELVDQDGGIRWGEQFTQSLRDLPALEEKIVGQVVESLQLEFTEVEQERFGKLYTRNPRAYDAYQKGRFQLEHVFTNEALRKAVDYYRQATEEDPDFAMAYAALAQAQHILGWRTHSRETYEQARDNAAEALRIDETLAEAHEIMAQLLALLDRDWLAAEREYKRAEDLDPSNSTMTSLDHRSTAYYRSYYLLWMGRRQEAIALIERESERSDPLSAIQQTQLAGKYWFAREYHNAIERIERANELDPGTNLNWLVEWCYLGAGLQEEAFSVFLVMREDSLGAETFDEYRRVFKVSGMQGVYRLNLENPNRGKASRTYDEAARQALGGNLDLAFALLDKTYFEELDYPPFMTDNRFDLLRSDPRFEQLLLKLNLPEEAIQKHLGLPGGLRVSERSDREWEGVPSLSPTPKENSGDAQELSIQGSRTLALMSFAPIYVRL